MLGLLTFFLNAEGAQMLIEMPIRYPEHRYLLLAGLCVSHIAGFIIPSFFFWKFMDNKIGTEDLRFDKKLPLYYALFTVLVMVLFIPLIGWTGSINRALVLPEFLSNLEQSIKSMEENAENLSKALLVIKGFENLLVVVLILAIVPAIGEEMIFRGLIQNKLYALTNNKHTAIWLAAFVFSAMHLQFYGFLPRFLLGALLGYIYVWGGNIWLPILGHFVNNATVVVMAYLAEQKALGAEATRNLEEPLWQLALLSLVAGGAGLLWLYKNRSQPAIVQSQI